MTIHVDEYHVIPNRLWGLKTSLLVLYYLNSGKTAMPNNDFSCDQIYAHN